MASFNQVQFKLGENIRAVVSELPSKGILIVDISGSLYRVINATFKNYKVGETLYLKVSQVNPLEFQIENGESSATRNIYRRTV